jgi:hypothetical protein
MDQKKLDRGVEGKEKAIAEEVEMTLLRNEELSMVGGGDEGSGLIEIPK